MKKRNIGVLVVPLMISLCGSNSYAGWGNQNSSAQNFAGACMIGAAVLGVVGGAVAVANWCFSETDDQLIARFERECSTFNGQYNDMINFVATLDVHTFPSDVGHMMDYYGALHSLEKGLYETATRIANSGTVQHTYRTNVITAKNQLKSSMSTLYKHIHALERKNRNYDEQRRLLALRTLSHSAEKLINRATFFADYLEHHKGYFNVFGIVSELRINYANCFAIAEQAGVYAENDLKNGIISAYGGRYPFRTFVSTIESDIARLRSGIKSLLYNYDGKRYADAMLNQLVWMKNVVTVDCRYTQECYQWEQERLQKLQIEALEAQARAMREQNRILEHNNWLRQQELWRRNCDTDVKVIVHL